MKAVVMRGYGAPNVLEYVQDAPRPQCAANQVVIAVEAASVNPLDCKTRSGELRLMLRRRFPLVLGNDVSGRVVKVGADVEGFAPGDEVFCMLDANARRACNGFAMSGSYAEYAVTRADTLCRKPQNLSHVEAAAVPLAALTAHQALVDRAKLREGQRILINGASGGVGSFAVQIAKALGAHVTAVCSARNVELVEGLGADRVIDYRETDFCEESRQYDVVYDVVSNRSFGECCGVLGPAGVYVQNVATLSSFAFPLVRPAAKLFGREKRLEHVWVTPSGEELAKVARLIEAGAVRPVVESVYPLDRAAQAHEAVESGGAAGKTVLRVA
ncbi:NAD(P)-dependent alcohol dehydrogenase [Persicimonas caeni]|nr:NAD(P)-dependent alcohol dehydrogenase [Persicimonas caeni]